MKRAISRTTDGNRGWRSTSGDDNPPQHRPRTPTARTDATGDPRPARRRRVLVADDEARIRLALRTCLESEGYEVDEAADGMEALDVIVRRAPDVMVLDLAMPVLDGLSALDRKSVGRGLVKPRVIVLTVWGSVPAAFRAS